MKIEYIENQYIDQIKWDKCIEMSYNGRVYACSWYLDAICHWDALILGDYEAVMPLPNVKKMGIKMIYTPFMIQQLGIFSKQTLTQKFFDNFINKIPASFKKIHLNINSDNDFDASGFTKTASPNYELALNKSYEQLYKQYNQNTKRNLKKAKLVNWKENQNIKPIDCVEMFKDYKGKNLEQDEQYYENVIKIMRSSIEKGNGQIISLSNADEVCASVFFIFHQNRIYNLFPSSNEFGKKNGAMFSIIDTLISQNENSDKIIDFEGSRIEGVARFYKGFGSKPRNYWTIERNVLPSFLKLLMNFKR